MRHEIAVTLASVVGIATQACKSRTHNDRPQSAAKMVLTSTPECNEALKTLSGMRGLTPAEIDDEAPAREVCDDTAPGSGIEGVGDGTGRALCAEARKAASSSGFLAKSFADQRRFVGWSAYASVPIMMSCNSFKKLGESTYGRKSYKQIYRVFLRSLIPSDAPGVKTTSVCGFSSPMRDIDFLVQANGLLPVALNEDLSSYKGQARIDFLDSKFRLRKDDPQKTGLRQGEVYQAIPMSDKEIAFVAKEWSDGTMEVKVIDEPFMSTDVTPPAMVSGSFAYHTPRDALCGKLEEWQRDASSLDSKKSDPKKYAEAVAALTRRCIAIHPFGDGNGRTCGLWSVQALARGGQVTSSRWPSEDYSMPLVEYSAYFLKGMDNATSLAASVSAGTD